MIERALFQVAFSNEWGRQMRFITGPRQSGKTTLAQRQLQEHNCSDLYYLWDLRSVRNRYKENQLFIKDDHPPKTQKQWVCFDEIHKLPKWKNALKAIFDSTSNNYQYIMTGSAKLDIFRRAGDSLSGRYFTFHLFPLSLSEIVALHKVPSKPPNNAHTFIQRCLDNKIKSGEGLSHLLAYGGFPEPFLKQSKAFCAKWSEDYTDTVIKEDIGALTRIIANENLYDLYHLLPQMVGSPLSQSSLASHLELNHVTVKNYLKRLCDFYLAFKIHPYSKNIKRALLKAPKCYLFDWTLMEETGRRFENYIAVELMSRIHLWMDSSGDKYDLFYIRNRQKEETDFLILKNKKPWLMIEAKYSDAPIENHHIRTQAMLGGIPLVQVCRKEGILKKEAGRRYRISASQFFS